MIVALTGFMGAGKSSTGKELSRILGCRFTDLDEYITHKAGKSISELFSEGEERFRALEAEAVRDVFIMSRIEGFDLVVALGGGSLINPEILSLVTRESTLVWLIASNETLKKRLEGTERQRPLLEKSNIDFLFGQRIPGYEKSVIRLDTEDKTPAEAAEEIANLLK